MKHYIRILKDNDYCIKNSLFTKKEFKSQFTFIERYRILKQSGIEQILINPKYNYYIFGLRFNFKIK
jgi:hypothetical protein